MLQEGRESASFLRETNGESKCHTIASRWLNVCHLISLERDCIPVAKCLSLDIIRERLTIDDVVTEDKAIQAGSRTGSSRATYEPGSSSRQCKYKEIDELCLYILEF